MDGGFWVNCGKSLERKSIYDKIISENKKCIFVYFLKVEIVEKRRLEESWIYSYIYIRLEKKENIELF